MNNSMADIRNKGLMALTNELGPVGAVLFMRQFESGSGDYTMERNEFSKDLTIDDIVSSIKARKADSRTE